jgi:RimJ/RimL family protein N-acetyltransferase
VGAQGKVECRFGGEHIVWTDRLRLSLARHSEEGLSRQLFTDETSRHWLGVDPDTEFGPWTPLPGRDPLPRLSQDRLPFIGVETTTGAVLASAYLYKAGDGGYGVLGVVAAGSRARGYGWEALTGLCELAHHHFGIARLVAECEDANIGAVECLSSCGFRRVGDPVLGALRNGRVIESLAWERVEPTAHRACREFPAA